MPVSTSIHISHCLNQIIALQPRSVLDVGCGFGLWGFLCREYLDAFNERVRREDWQVRITGVELFRPYIQTHQEAVYDRIVIGDIREQAANLEPHDLVIAGDVIEHLEKDEAREVLRLLYAKAEKALLVNIPLGDGWDHGIVHGNPGELHRSQWESRDFEEFLPDVQQFHLPCGRYGSFFCRKDLSPNQRNVLWKGAASRCIAQQDPDGALANLTLAHRFEPGDEQVALTLTELLLERRHTEEALRVLRATVAVNPGSHQAALLLARLLLALRRTDEGRTYLEALLSVPDLREEATRLLAQGL